MNRLQCPNNLILSAICEDTVSMYSNIGRGGMIC